MLPAVTACFTFTCKQYFLLTSTIYIMPYCSQCHTMCPNQHFSSTVSVLLLLASLLFSIVCICILDRLYQVHTEHIVTVLLTVETALIITNYLNYWWYSICVPGIPDMMLPHSDNLKSVWLHLLPS